MLKSSKISTLICGATAIAATVIFYLMIFDDIFTSPMIWVSLLFLILAESIGITKALFIKKTIFGVSNITTSLFHLGIVSVMSIIFVNISSSHVKAYILLNVLMLCLLLIVDVVIIYFAGYVGAKNKSLAESQSLIDTLCSKAKELMVMYKETSYKKDLEEISELLMYSDNSALSTDEVEILNKLEELQTLLSENNKGTPQKISEVKNVIKLRSLKIKSNKRGSY